MPRHGACDVPWAYQSSRTALYRSLAGGGASAPYGRDRRRGDQHGAEQGELPDRNGEIDAPIEGLAVDHINQDEAQHAAQSEAVERRRSRSVSSPSPASMPTICRRSMPMCRSMPNSARRARAVELAAKLTPASPIRTAMASSA